MIRFRPSPIFMALGVIVLGFSSNARAACSGSSPSWTSTPDQASVSTCVANASAGDTINVSAGSATWSGNITLPKTLNLIGAGAGNTVITGQSFTLDGLPNASRISGFTFNMPVGGTYMNIDGGQQGWRIDHNTFNRTVWDFSIFPVGALRNGTSPQAVEGLIDHNTFVNSRVVIYGEYGDTGGNTRWSEPLNEGTAHAVYYEDNTSTMTDPNCLSGGAILCNSIDGNNAARYVARFNTINNSYFEAHSLACAGGAGPPTSGCRGTRLVEIYNNTLNVTSTGGYSRPFFMRAGTGMIFHNSSPVNSYSENHVDFNYIRSCESKAAFGTTFDLCDGTRFMDGNTGTALGYQCRDQPGTGGDVSMWGTGANFPNPAPAQTHSPFYIWKNSSPGGEQTTVVAAGNCDAAHEALQILQIAENRDYYQYQSSFNGTVGVGEGTLANRPSTCTTGVGYWATDQGSWNKSNNGAGQGALFTCTSTNTWTLNYQPYTYPHPLQAAGGSQPAPPTGLQANVN